MRKLKYYTRKTHRYLGLIIGIQLLLWTIGGLYFSWTNIDEIHGDHLVNFPDTSVKVKPSFLPPAKALSLAGLNKQNFEDIQLKEVLNKTYYRIRNGGSFMLVDAETGEKRKPLSENEAVSFAKEIFKPDAEIKDIDYVTAQNIRDHWQYRGGPLPAWAVSFEHPSNSVIYISAEKGTFEKIRNKQWRIFDYLWMLHIMDFKDRDNINNIILRIFSVLSLITVISGFVLFYQSSKTLRKTKKYFNN